MLNWLWDFWDWYDDWLDGIFGTLDPFSRIVSYIMVFCLCMAVMMAIVIGVVKVYEMLL